MAWMGQETVESFECVLAQGASRLYEISGTAFITMSGLLITRIDFELPVGKSTTDDPVSLSQTSKRPQTAFASYASADRHEVLRSVQGIKKAAPELEVFIDVDSLRSGAKWEEKLYAFISTSDIFYLFWSQAAAASEWVGREWKYGLRQRGIEFIDPFPLESPQLVPPPPELSTLNFNDRYQMFILADERVQSLKAEIGSATSP